MSFDWGSLVGLLPSLLSTFASAGPWGIVAMVLGSSIIGGVLYYFVKRVNDKIDASDESLAGADSGDTATDLKEQAQKNKKFMDSEFEKFKEGLDDGKI